MAKRSRERERIADLEARLRVPGLPRLDLLSRDQLAFLDAFNITLGMLSDPVATYAYTLTTDGVALVARLFQATAIVEIIEPTDAPEIAQNKWLDLIK
ncbi:hypothetical protein NKI09_17625 [Mesorhizobium sp. M0757]|uniref:hypothetical protein n=1 Tax=Mesorhizobium sp. M0757 TaxID=2956993 RepID=UPI003339B55D